jgi:hypothetical protein
VTIVRHLPLPWPLLGLFLLLAAPPAAAWTPKMQQTIAIEAAGLAPPDLRRQLDRHVKAYKQGVLAPFDDGVPAHHTKSEDGGGQLDREVAESVARAIAAIRGHRPFEEIVEHLGVLSHWVADANNPLAVSAADPEKGRYFVDYLRYAESAQRRFPLVFYGIRPGFERRPDVAPLVGDALARGRSFSRQIADEYRRIGFASGVGHFDDRSSAFGVASIAFSRAVTDVAVVLRYVWIRAGGIDSRTRLPSGGDRVLLLPRTAAR